jgi:hypothetical protein
VEVVAAGADQAVVVEQAVLEAITAVEVAEAAVPKGALAVPEEQAVLVPSLLRPSSKVYDGKNQTSPIASRVKRPDLKNNFRICSMVCGWSRSFGCPDFHGKR